MGQEPMTEAEATGLGAGWEDLRHRARSHNLAKVPDIEVAVTALLQHDLGEPARERAALQAHKIAGSAGTFGLPLASDLARRLERLFAAPGPGPERGEEARELVAHLRGELT